MYRVPLLFCATFAMFMVASCHAESPHLAPGEAARRVADGEAVLVDVREPDEWRETGIVAGATPLALSDLRGARATWKPFLAANKDRELILYCRSGNRSGQAAPLLAAEGYRTANAGGLRDWRAAGQTIRPMGTTAKP
ncbi:MAG: rhodanese-like domain-containing protein [Opitutaceae bacterium]